MRAPPFLGALAAAAAASAAAAVALAPPSPAALRQTLALAAHARSRRAATAANCTAIAEVLCRADAHCAAFGLFGAQIQLHGCAAPLIANPDWQISTRHGDDFTTLPGTQNIDEDACAQHPDSGMEHTCSAPPAPPLYTKVGSLDVGTFETTVFYWHGALLSLENIPCGYWDHAGVWDVTWGNHSYARLRDFMSGRVVANVSLTSRYGFVTPFADYDNDRLWLFGTPADRCGGNGSPTTVQSWLALTPDLQSWSSALAFDFGLVTHNVQVTRVGPMGGSSEADVAAWHALRAQRSGIAAQLPPHRYAMMLECFSFAVSNDAYGNLTAGWQLLNGTKAPAGAPCGGPAMYYNPSDDHYHILTGGNIVRLYRTQDFVTWQESAPSPFIAPSEEDADVAPFAGFPLASRVKGSPPNRYVGVPEPFPRRPFDPFWRGSNWTSWVRNSNDADFCCFHKDVAASIMIWGASTQGGAPAPPLTGSDAGTNAAATAAMPLDALLAAYFANASAYR